MNPKDMTNKELVKNHAEARAFAENSDYDLATKGALKVSENCADELLRRLNERDELIEECDALRKENEGLRKDKEKLLKDYAELRVNSALLVACDDALEALELDNTKESEIDALRKDKERIDFLDDGNYGIDPRNIPGVMMNGRRFHCLAGRGDWSSLRDAIDAARLAKESEASHE